MQHKPGFGLLEALITLAIAVLIASVITSRIMRDQTQQDLQAILYTCNTMLTTARQEARRKHCAMRLNLYAKSLPHTVTLEQEKQNPQAPGTTLFTPATIIGSTSSFQLPITWSIQAVYNGTHEQLAEHKNTATCVIGPVGILPSMLIHLKAAKGNQVVTLKTEPFLKTFTLHTQKIAPPKKPGGRK